MPSLFPFATLFTAAAMVIVYIVSTGYYAFKQPQILHYTDDLYQCSEYPYPVTYFRKRMEEHNDTYVVYNVQIGKILAQNMTKSQIEEIEYKIRMDSLMNQLNTDKTNPHNIQMRETYESYYDEFHHNGIPRCPWNNPTQIDFFDFVQIDAPLASNTVTMPIQANEDKYYYIEMPSDRAPTLNSEHMHYAPQLFSYTLSMTNGRLPGLEFRFGEINNPKQHDNMRHLLLNGVHTHLLWAGEFWYFFDHNYQQYVLVCDNDSGHWKPEMNAKPPYLEDILLKTLFTNYDKENRDGHDPLLIVGYDDAPWQDLKLRLFPVLEEIAERDYAKFLAYQSRKRAAYDAYH
eukprot:84968_1